MNEADAMDLMRLAVWAAVVIAGPAVGAAMTIGIVIALFQALTQVQEASLTFVPKIVVILAMLFLTAPLIASELLGFSEALYSRIATGF